MPDLRAPAPAVVRGPFFDELAVGQVFDGAPSVTLTDGLASCHRSILGNRLRLTLDRTLAKAVTGRGDLAPPPLVWDVAIGQSTSVTQHVKANLFYRGLRLLRLPSLGDTLTTVTTVDGLKQNAGRPGRSRTGLAALHIETNDQLGRPVLDFWRCAMLPLSPEAPEGDGPGDDLDEVGAGAASELAVSVDGWDLGRFRELVPGPHASDLAAGQSWVVEGADVVSSAPELARLTGNVAKVHHDLTATGGERLVYGGHTIGLAFHQLCRALPNLVTVAAWQRCDHVGPVREGDGLTSVVSLESLDPHQSGGALARLRVIVDATRPGGEPTPVLDWVLHGILA